MKQISLATTGYELITKRTRKRIFLKEMNLVVPWTELVGLIQPHSSPEPVSKATNKGGRPAFRVETMLRIHFLQQWFGLSDPAMEEALEDIPMYWQFAQLDPGITRLPDETTILRFRHLLETNDLSLQIMATISALLTQRGLLLRTGTVVDATLIAAPSSTKNKDHARDPEMHSSKKGNQMYFGMKAHIGASAESGIQWHIAMRPGKRKALNKDNEADALIDKAERLKAGIRAKVEHPFRVIKRQFGFMKVRYRGLKKNTAQLITLFALSNLWMVREKLIGAGA